MENCGRSQVPSTVILTYSFWLWQRGCIKGIAKSWAFVKWRWMWWFGMKVIFYLGSDALCLVMQQPLQQQHDSPGKWILIRKGWCFSLSLSLWFSFFLHSFHPSLSHSFAVYYSASPYSCLRVSLPLSVALCLLSSRNVWCMIKYDGCLEQVLIRTPGASVCVTQTEVYKCVCVNV